MPERRGRGFSPQQVQRLKDLGLTSRHIDALVKHALPKIRQHLHSPPRQEIRALLQDLASAARAMQDAVCAIRHPGALERRRSKLPPASKFEDELRQSEADKKSLSKVAMSLLTSTWVDASSKYSLASTEPDVDGKDILTPIDQLDRLNEESHSVEILVLAAMAQYRGQARKTVGNPEPVVEIWSVIERTNRNLEALRLIAASERRPLPAESSLLPPWQRGSRFDEVVEICFEAAGYVGRPKSALLAAKRILKGLGASADGNRSQR